MSRSASSGPSVPRSPAILPIATLFLLVAPSAPLMAQSGSPDPAASSGASERAYAPAPGEPTLEEMREALGRFVDVEVALEEGYVQDPSGMCFTAEMEGRSAEEGAMGIHYFRPDLLGLTSTEPPVTGTGTHTDFRRPAILLYEPQPDGSLELVGVENLVFEEAWRAAGHEEPPTFHGRAYDHMVDDPTTPDVSESHDFAPHFDQHVYLYRDNPLGTLEPFNPNVTCQHVAAAIGDHDGMGGR